MRFTGADVIAPGAAAVAVQQSLAAQRRTDADGRSQLDPCDGARDGDAPGTTPAVLDRDYEARGDSGSAAREGEVEEQCALPARQKRPGRPGRGEGHHPARDPAAAVCRQRPARGGIDYPRRSNLTRRRVRLLAMIS